MNSEKFWSSVEQIQAWCKTSGDDAEEPSKQVHSHSPAQALRPRSEVIVFGVDGILAIKKKNYLLLPGGGIADGETPESTAIREAMEEANITLKNMEKIDVVHTTYDRDNIISPGWDGETTHFYRALCGVDAKVVHPDRENFRFIPFDECISFLSDLLKSPKEQWALKNNTTRLNNIKEAKKMANNPVSFLLRKYANRYRNIVGAR